MVQKKVNVEALKARIEAMKASNSSLLKIAADRMEKIINRKNKEA